MNTSANCCLLCLMCLCDSFFSMVDLLTVIPTWATLGTTAPVYSDISSIYTGVLYVLNLFKASRVLRPLRIRRKLQSIEDEVQRTLVDILLRSFSMILFSMSSLICLICHLLNRDIDVFVMCSV